MKRYDMRIGFNIPECEDVIKPFESEHGKWVPAEVAQALYDALDGLRSCDSVSLEYWLASGAEIALSLADGESE